MIFNNQNPIQLPCSPITTSIPFPATGETGAIIVQDDAFPQTITTIVVVSPNIARFTVGFNRFFPSPSNNVTATAVNPNPSPTPPPTVNLVPTPTVTPSISGAFTGMQVLNSGIYTLTSGISLTTTAGIDPGALFAAITLFPGGTSSTTPTTLALIPLNISVQGFTLLRGTTQVSNVALSVGDIVQVQIIQTGAVDNGEDLTVTYAWLEIE